MNREPHFDIRPDQPGATATLGFFRRLRRALVGGYCALALALCGVATWYALQDRADRINAATQHANTLLRSLDEHVRRSFNAVDVLLFDTAADIAVAGGIARADRARLFHLFRAKVALLPQVRAMFAYGPDSVLQVTTTAAQANRVDGRAFEYVAAHRRNDVFSLFVGRPHTAAPISGLPSIPVTRRIPHPGDAFGGVIGAALDPGHIQAFYRDLGLTRGQGLALMRADGTLLVRFPDSVALPPGTDLSQTELFTAGVAHRTAGTVRFVSGLDGEDRIIAFRQIPDIGLVVSVAQEVDEILAPWRWNTAAIAAGLAGTLASLLLLLWVSLRQIERRVADECRLAEAEERYRSLVELAPIGIAQHVNGVIEYANAELARIHGLSSPRALVGRSVAELVHPIEFDRIRARIAQLAAGPGKDEPRVFRVRRANGAEAEVEVHAVSIRQGGRLITQAVVRDVTEARRAAEEVQRLNETLEEKVRDRTAELEAANRELESFSYSVSHDLRAPLRAMAGFAGILRIEHAASLPPAAMPLLARIEAGAKRMSELIEDLLGLARVARQEMHLARVDLSRLARDIAADLAAANPDRAVDVQIAPNLTAHADPLLLRIALQNLIENAWKYTAKRADARIEFGVETRGGERTFYVRDNGAGFEMKYVGQLFRAFHRLHSDHEYEGTGIGLATVERIIRRHGGRIWANAAPEKGATFHFVLPERR
jgi:PAS domain S-box-containing protein